MFRLDSVSFCRHNGLIMITLIFSHVTSRQREDKDVNNQGIAFC